MSQPRRPGYRLRNQVQVAELTSIRRKRVTVDLRIKQPGAL
jgi:hypothetical protein